MKIPKLTPEQLAGEEGRQIPGTPAWWQAQAGEARDMLSHGKSPYRRPGRCATTGCRNPASHELTYSWPESRDTPERELVCGPCAADYMRRPVIKPSVRNLWGLTHDIGPQAAPAGSTRKYRRIGSAESGSSSMTNFYGLYGIRGNGSEILVQYEGCSYPDRKSVMVPGIALAQQPCKWQTVTAFTKIEVTEPGESESDAHEH